MKLTSALIASSSAILLSGCMSLGPVAVPPNSAEIELDEVQFMPSPEAMKRNKSTVVILPLKEVDDLAKKSHLGALAKNLISEHVINAGAEVIDRELSTKLREELKKLEFEGKLQSSLLSASADYVVLGEVSQVNVTSSFTKTRYYTDKEGNTRVIPSSCTYTGKLTGSYKVVNPKTGSIVSNFKLKDTETDSSESNNSSCPISDYQSTSLVKEAMSDSVRDTKTELKNFFAPKGYLINAKQTPDGKQFFVEISLGKTSGIKAGEKIEFFETVESTNKVTKKTSIKDKFVASGTATSTIDDSSAWVLIDNEMKQSMKIGLTAKTKFEDSFMDSFTKIVF